MYRLVLCKCMCMADKLPETVAPEMDYRISRVVIHDVSSSVIPT